jgi:uncharacterized protein (DUF362 family)
MNAISRRYFFFGSLALATACRKQALAPRVTPRQVVSIVRAGSYSVDLTDRIKRILMDHQVEIRGKRILLKPNLVEFDPHRPINTHPVFVAAAADAFWSLGAHSVRIAEGPGHRRTTLDMAEAAGYFSLIHKFEDNFTDLNLDDVQAVKIAQPFSTLKELYLPNTVRNCDLLVSMPKMKTHHWAGATLSMKNLFGVVPGAVYGWPKNVLHWAGINECIADLHCLFPKQFSLVDGIEAMQGNGPILGYAKHAGVIVAGAHAPSVDATCCRIMQIAPEKIGYLQLIARRSGWKPQHAMQRAETVASVRTPFDLIPDFASLRG